MKPYDDDQELTNYVWNHFAQFFTPVEAKGRWAVFADRKARAGRKHVVNDIWQRQKLADDPELMAALADGIEPFRLRTAKRVLSEHAAEVFVNRCPKCSRVVATSKGAAVPVVRP